MLLAVVPHLLCKLRLELAAAIGLHGSHPAQRAPTVEAPSHAAVEKRCAMFCGKSRTQQHIGLTAVDVNDSEGK